MTGCLDKIKYSRDTRTIDFLSKYSWCLDETSNFEPLCFRVSGLFEGFN